MSDKPEPPSRTVETDLRVAHLTKAVTRKGEIGFELHVPENDSAPELAEILRQDLILKMSHVPGERFGPISVDEDERNPSKVTIVYKPDRVRNPRADMREIVSILEETAIPITQTVHDGIEHAFEALQALSTQGHAVAETTRRTAKKGPGDRRTPGT